LRRIDSPEPICAYSDDRDDGAGEKISFVAGDSGGHFERPLFPNPPPLSVNMK
jgi:hypothetical protein